MVFKPPSNRSKCPELLRVRFFSHKERGRGWGAERLAGTFPGPVGW